MGEFKTARPVGVDPLWCEVPPPTPGPIGTNRDYGQCVAGGAAASVWIDPMLQERNRLIEETLLESAEAYYRAGDLRWFFSLAHATITQQINANLAIFEQPNPLLRLNIHFSEAFVRAIDGHGSDLWEDAFRLCQALEENKSIFIPEAEVCASRMAAVHIFVDLSAALREAGCISPADYGNMLVFVNRGSLAAQVRLRGRAVGAAEAVLQQLICPLVDLDVKAWRNAVFMAACQAPVPDPARPFPTRPAGR